MSAHSPYRRPHPNPGGRPVPCAHCGEYLDPRQSVLILSDERDALQLYCVRPDCAQAFGEAIPPESRL